MMKTAYFEDVIDRENLSEMLKVFHSVTGLCTYLMNHEGKIVLQYGPTYSYCTFVYSHIPETVCHRVRVEAGKMAMEIGSSYIFSCHANLNHIAFPIMQKDVFIGSIQVGPFLMNPPDSSLVTDIRKKYDEFSAEDILTLYDDAADIPQVSTEKVTQISKLLYYLLTSLITDSKDRFIINQEKMDQQAKINEAIQVYKNEQTQTKSPYPIEKEKALIDFIKVGNEQKARDTLNELLGYLFLMYGGNISMMRMRAVEIGSVLVHAILEYSTSTERLFSISNHFLHRVTGVADGEELSLVMQELAKSIMDCLYPVGDENKKVIRKMMKYISMHHSEPLTLKTIAENIHMNPAYLSHLFKKEIGMTFREYLNFVRIEEAKRLLRHTDYSIIDIAMAVGYESQSYFSQVFRKCTGVAPNRFRQ